MDTPFFFESKLFSIITWITAGLIVIFSVFKLGMLVGEGKARFFCRWSDNYHQNFGAPRQGLFPRIGDHMFLNAHGSEGKIISKEESSFVIQGKDGVEKVITVSDDVAIRRGRDELSSDDLAVNMMVIVIGEPVESGAIAAKLIRILPERL